MSEDVILNAGTTIGFAANAEGTSFTIIPHVDAFGGLGFTAEAKDKTSLGDTYQKQGHGLKKFAEKAIKGKYIPKPDAEDTELTALYTAQQAFFTKCKALEEFKLQVVFSDGEKGEFLFKSLGFNIPEGTGEDWKMFECPGIQNSEVDWTAAT